MTTAATAPSRFPLPLNHALSDTDRAEAETTAFDGMYWVHGGDTGEWRYATRSAKHSSLYSNVPPTAATVRERLDQSVPADAFGWLDYRRAVITHVWPDIRLTEMCSPDFFESAIARGDGRLVALRITPVDEPRH